MRTLAASLLVLCMGGCCLPFGVVRHYQPDPDRASAIEVRDIVGSQAMLADGRSVGVSGTNLHLVTEDQSLEQDLAKDQRKKLVGQHVLVAKESAGKARMTAIDYRTTEERYEGFFCPLLAGLGSKYHRADAAVVILIPIVVDVHDRWDVGEAFLENGLATTAPPPEPGYEAVERRAHKAGRGIWMGQSERLVDLIKRDRPQDAAAMLEKGASPEAADGGGTALTYAVSRGHPDLVRALLAKGADPNRAASELTDPPLLLACESGSVEIVRLLIASGADVNKGAPPGRRPLLAAANEGNPEIVSLLLEHGAKVNQADPGGPSALDCAAGRNREAATLVLLSKGADPGKSDDRDPPLVVFAGEGNLRMVKALVGAGADVNSGFRQTPLEAAAGSGIIPVAEYLLSKGANINGRGGDTFTPLKAATMSRRTEMAEFLRARGGKE